MFKWKESGKEKKIRKQENTGAGITAIPLLHAALPFSVWVPLTAPLETGMQVIYVGEDPKM